MEVLPKYYLLNGKLESFKSGLSIESLLLEWLPGTIEMRWRSSGSRIPFFKEQYRRFKSFAFTVQSDLDWLPDQDLFHHQLVRLIQGNRLYKGVEIRIYLKPGKELSDSPDLFVVSFPHPDEQYLMNPSGWILGPCPGQLIPERSEFLCWEFHPIHRQKWQKLAQESETDTLYFTNSEGHLLDSPQGHIFLIKGSKIFTPENERDLAKRAILNPIRECCRELGLKFAPSTALLPEHLDQADEVFLASDFSGIIWIMGHKKKRFFRKMSPEILRLINRDWARLP